MLPRVSDAAHIKLLVDQHLVVLLEVKALLRRGRQLRAPRQGQGQGQARWERDREKPSSPGRPGYRLQRPGGARQSHVAAASAGPAKSSRQTPPAAPPAPLSELRR